MKAFGRIIGIDVGTKRIGVARTDLLRTSANPVGTYSPQEVIEVIESFRDQAILAFVVGWPLSTSGEETPATEMVDRFVGKLEKKFTGIPVYRVDERYSSKKAVETMIKSGVPKKKRGRKGRVDQAAAALLLQHFLETNNDFE